MKISVYHYIEASNMTISEVLEKAASDDDTYLSNHGNNIYIVEVWR